MGLMSIQMQKYFEDIEKRVNLCYDFANNAKKIGVDPENFVDVPLAKNMAERVVGLISIVAPQIKSVGVENRIIELENKYKKLDWRVALVVSLEVAQEKFCKFKDMREAMEVGIRIGLAYLTVGVVVSPIEGFVRLEIKKRMDGKDYLCLYFSGPIRSAGGTATAVTLLVADYIRKEMGFGVYDPSEAEIKRAYIDVRDYHERVTNLQYYPSEEEVVYLIKNYALQIDGDTSDKIEVSNYRDLPRIGTNFLRSGFSLVVAECFAQKSKKVYAQLQKWGNEFGLEHWNFLKDFLSLQEKIKAGLKLVEVKNVKISPDFTYIRDIVAGRPVFTYPLRQGGFRLRYGRCRTSGFSAQAVHPATMIIVSNFIAIGTQLKVERPGKSTVIASCDTVDGPIVKLKNGDVIRVDSIDLAQRVVKDVQEIIYLGDLLINYGDFLNRAHKLVPCGYNEEFWMAETNSTERSLNINQAILKCRELGWPLHPRYVFFWNCIIKEQFQSLVGWLKSGFLKEENLYISLIIEADPDLGDKNPKRVLELLGVPHIVRNNEVIVESEWCKALLFSLNNLENLKFDFTNSVLDYINTLCGGVIRDKAGTFIGARMGRPEKAKMRKMTGSPHVLFPVGEEGGRLRSVLSACQKGCVTGEFPLRYCLGCKTYTIYPVCEKCDGKTLQRFMCKTCGVVDKEECHGKCLLYSRREIPVKDYLDRAIKSSNLKILPEIIKGVRGTSNDDHVPENLMKGLFRANYGLYVNKDGTIRYDMIEMPITHFKCKEIGISIEKVKELGYLTDVYGDGIFNEDQIIELKPQDVILPSCPETLDQKCDDVLFKVSKFVDDLLVSLYKSERFYNFKSVSDLVGNLVVCMSPHTSAGIISRIIGFSKTQGFLAHPYLHSIMRRDADGDECAIILLMDLLLNFSKKFIPSTRGAKQDEPLILTYVLIPSEVDDMVFDMDTAFSYPLELYKSALEYKLPSEVKIEKVGQFLGTEKQYEGFGFTHDTSDLNSGVRCSSYKSIPTMEEKVQKQMFVGDLIRAVDVADVAKLVIERHFLRDIKGNFAKFSKQQFRCVKCNTKYRRPPLLGRCLKCDNKLMFTISEGGIIKYLNPSLSLAERYNLPKYMQQNLDLLKFSIESVFGREKERQEDLGKWF